MQGITVARGIGERPYNRRGQHFYSLGGRSADSAATQSHGLFCLWNPSTTIPIWITYWSYTIHTSTTATYRPWFDRFTARGTAGSTVTADIDSDWDDYVAPASGAVLDLAAYSVQPTTQGGTTNWINRFQTTTNPGENPMYFQFARPFLIPPQSGWGGINAGNAVAAGGDICVEWFE